MDNLKAKAYQLRKDTIDIIMAGGGGHIGGDMSVMEILVSLYFQQMRINVENPEDPERDLFILSKGHSMEAYYAVLCEKGFLDYKDVIQRFSKFDSPYIGHPHNVLPGIEMNSGSLGHGLPVAVGMALAAKMDQKKTRVYVVVGDGELAEGSNWEAFMAGAMYKLDNLCCVIDRNYLQISGNTEDVMALDNLKNKLEAFGWEVIVVQDGNDLDEVNSALERAKKVTDKPVSLIANTIKGKGSPIMENRAEWHHHVPSEEEYNQIIKDLDERKEEFLNEQDCK